MPEHIYCSSPMRGKEFLKDWGVLDSDQDKYAHPMASPSGITARDFNDVRTCDAMVACFLDSGGKLSGGTFSEYGIAYSFRVPIIGIGSEDDPNIRHLMAQRFIDYRLDTLEQAANIVSLLLTPGI